MKVEARNLSRYVWTTMFNWFLQTHCGAEKIAEIEWELERNMTYICYIWCICELILVNCLRACAEECICGGDSRSLAIFFVLFDISCVPVQKREGKKRASLEAHLSSYLYLMSSHNKIYMCGRCELSSYNLRIANHWDLDRYCILSTRRWFRVDYA